MRRESHVQCCERLGVKLPLAALQLNDNYLDSFSSASFVPSIRDFIFAKAVSLEVEKSSAKGENPQSSVVPSRSGEIISAASKIVSQISWGVSTLGSSTSVTPRNTR